MQAPIRLIIADDHALFRQGLKSMLMLEENVTVVGEVERVSDLAPLMMRTPCDVVLLDLQMERSALIDIEDLASRVHVVVVTASEQPDDALAAVRLGAQAVVLKRFAIETLIDAIRAVAEGNMWLPPALQTELSQRYRERSRSGLTPREYQIVRHAALGLRNAEIAQRLFISEVTVKTHLNNVFQKLGIRHRVELARYAIRIGIVGTHEHRP